MLAELGYVLAELVGVRAAGVQFGCLKRGAEGQLRQQKGLFQMTSWWKQMQ